MTLATSSARTELEMDATASRPEQLCEGMGLVGRGVSKSGRVSVGANRGFTLIELLVVITLVVALMGILATFGLHYQQRGYFSRTEALLTRLDLYCDEYKERSNRFPADGIDSEVETEEGTPLRSGAALAYALTQPVKLTRVTSSGRREEIGTADPIAEFTDSELEKHPDDDAAAEILDAWGKLVYYDNVAKGASAYSPQESVVSQFDPGETFLPDPRDNPDLVERTGPQNLRGVDMWSFGPGGDTNEGDVTEYVGNWSQKSQAE